MDSTTSMEIEVNESTDNDLANIQCEANEINVETAPELAMICDNTTGASAEGT